MKTRILQISSEPRVVWGIVATIIFCLITYVFLINQTVYNVVKRQKIEKQVSDLRFKVGSLESDYIFLKNKVTLDTAFALGFRESASSEFVKRKSLGQSGLSNNEI